MSSSPEADYNAESDILFIKFSDDPVARSGELGWWTIIDYGWDDSVLAVEFVNASRGIDPRDVPSWELIEPLIHRFNLPLASGSEARG